MHRLAKMSYADIVLLQFQALPLMHPFQLPYSLFPKVLHLMLHFHSLNQAQQLPLDSLTDWVNMFDKAPFEGMDEALKDEIVAEAEAESKEKLYHDGSWYFEISVDEFLFGSNKP